MGEVRPPKGNVDEGACRTFFSAAPPPSSLLMSGGANCSVMPFKMPRRQKGAPPPRSVSFLHGAKKRRQPRTTTSKEEELSQASQMLSLGMIAARAPPQNGRGRKDTRLLKQVRELLNGVKRLPIRPVPKGSRRGRGEGQLCDGENVEVVSCVQEPGGGSRFGNKKEEKEMHHKLVSHPSMTFPSHRERRPREWSGRDRRNWGRKRESTALKPLSEGAKGGKEECQQCRHTAISAC